MVIGLFRGRKDDRDIETTTVSLMDIEQSEEPTPAEIYIRVATLTSLTQLPELKREIFKGNIIMLDVSGMKNDKLTMNRALKDLKEVTIDMKGDIAGIGEQWVVVTPTAIKVDRTRLSVEEGV